MLFCSRGVLYMGLKPHEILFGEELWHKFSLKVPTRGFQLKKEIRWGDFPANFFDWRGADFHQKRKSCGTTSPRDFSLADFDGKRKVWQKSLFQQQLFYLNDMMGNS